MQKIDEIIKLALGEDLKAQTLKKTPVCPNESDLVDYLTGSLPRKRRSEIDSHLSGCLACTEDLVLADKVSREGHKKYSGKTGLRGWLKKNIWLILAIVVFTASFVYSNYFVQFLVATLILAGKWIFETVNARILIMIYDAWKKGGEQEVSKVLERFSTRTGIK